MSINPIIRDRIARAQEATAKIDRDLWRPLERLTDICKPSNGAGIFCDIPRIKSALAEAAAAIASAQKIMNDTEWPSDRDYDLA